MRHAITRLREERRVLADAYREVRLGIGLNANVRDQMLRQLRREIRETEQAIGVLVRVRLAVDRAVEAEAVAGRPAPGARRQEAAGHA